MIEPRIYRAAFVPAILALILTAFSLESRPRALPQGLAADVLFDGEQTAAAALALAERHPDRRPGSGGDLAAADEVERSLEEDGFAVGRQEFAFDGNDLVNVIGRRPGSSRRQVVVVAGRDAMAVPDIGSSAADTAALIELGRVFEGRPSNKTIVLASIDGATLGDVGARRLVRELGDPDLVDGVIAISSLGLGEGRAPAIVPWGNSVKRTGIGLQRTLADSLRTEGEPPAPRASPAGQLARLAFPIGLGAQGPLLEAGYDAVRVAGDGGAVPSAEQVDAIDAERMAGLGRGVLRAVTALDQGPRPEGSPRAYLGLANQVLPGWALAILSFTLILPAIVASVDAFARARRRGTAVGSWLGWIAAGVISVLVALGIARLLAFAGATPELPSTPPPPGLHGLDGPAVAVMLAMLVVLPLAWAGLRRVLADGARGLIEASDSAGAAVALGLALSLAAAILWTLNPFAALFAAPAVHLWIVVALADPPPSRRVAVILLALGLVPPLVLAVYQLLALGLDPLGGAWYLCLLLLGGHMGPVAPAVAATFAACLVLAIRLVIGRREASEGVAASATTRGPLSYAGPGSLGGTDSALRR